MPPDPLSDAQGDSAHVLPMFYIYLSCNVQGRPVTLDSCRIPKPYSQPSRSFSLYKKEEAGSRQLFYKRDPFALLQQNPAFSGFYNLLLLEIICKNSDAFNIPIPSYSHN
ncbi:hypothetical protein Psch_03230 [Pelotomaculum schinkii]|uniref:Uncharacterized protein n=1 Tax=Pelotomaculum schinkii TaxID=78350 RepID=A0A4Y7RBI4_9FIRM|nr:hypothetical protein Psch_03230 [Pelotomaculum schinkii]